MSRISSSDRARFAHTESQASDPCDAGVKASANGAVRPEELAAPPTGEVDSEKSSVDRVEEMMDGVGQKVGAVTSKVGQSLYRFFARARESAEDFWAEARVVANLVHQHVVTIHNLGDDRGYHYIEMEYVPGGISLKESLAREGPFDPVRAATQAAAVAHAHGLRFIVTPALNLVTVLNPGGQESRWRQFLRLDSVATAVLEIGSFVAGHQRNEARP